MLMVDDWKRGIGGILVCNVNMEDRKLEQVTKGHRGFQCIYMDRSQHIKVINGMRHALTRWALPSVGHTSG